MSAVGPLGPDSRNVAALQRDSAVGHFRHFALRKIAALNDSVLFVASLRHHLSGMTMLAEIASDHVLDAAYDWLRLRRRAYSPNADVWAFRRDCAAATPDG
jgi:hypothetical protein